MRTRDADRPESHDASPLPAIDLGVESRPLRQRPWIKIALVLVVAAVFVGWGARWLLHDRYRVSTDDATIDSNQVMIMSRLSERVAKVLVDVNQPVRRGQTLVVLDDANVRARLAIARENLRALSSSARAARRAADLERETQSAQVRTQASRVDAARRGTALSSVQARASSSAVSVAEAQLAQARAGVRIADAALPAAADALRKALADQRRTADLSRQGYVSESALEGASAAVSQARSAYDAARGQSEAARWNVRTAQTKVQKALADALVASSAAGASQAQIPIAEGGLAESAAPSRVLDKEALAEASAASAAALEGQVRLAQLDLEATRITSPVDGIVASRGVEAGQTVAPGQTLLFVAPADHVFITANYKETQVARIRAGQTVEIAVDACHGEIFMGRVIGLGPVAQGALSTMPTMTSPSNFVKVAQRIPVRISLPVKSGSCVFRPGMSVETSVIAGAR